MTLINDYKEEETPKEDVQYNVILSPKVTGQQKTLYWDSNTVKRDKRISRTLEENNNIKTLCEKSDKTFNRAHDGYLPVFEEDDKNPSRDVNITS